MTDIPVTREEDEAFNNLAARRVDELQHEKSLLLETQDGLHSRNEQLEAQNRDLAKQLQDAEVEKARLDRLKSEWKAEAAMQILEWSKGLNNAESVRAHARNILRRASRQSEGQP